jgi:hypothetical protein
VSGDTVTIIRSRGRRLAKLIRGDGRIDGYEDARTFDLHELQVAGLAELAALLQRQECRSDCAIVRGGIADPERARRVRRLVHQDPVTGDVPTLVERPRQYLPLDFDGVPLPEGTDPHDLAACAAAAVAMLPPAFQGAQHIVAATGSHTLKPGARLRLWFWLDRAVGRAELEVWLRKAPVDRALFRPAQLIYTAAPIFPTGRADPLPRRTLLIPGRSLVQVPSLAALTPAPRRPALAPTAKTAGGNNYARTALTRATANVASAAVDCRHATAVSEAWGLARLVLAGLLTESEVKASIGWAIEHAGKTREEGEAIAAWAIAHRTSTGPTIAGAAS